MSGKIKLKAVIQLVGKEPKIVPIRRIEFDEDGNLKRIVVTYPLSNTVEWLSYEYGSEEYREAVKGILRYAGLEDKNKKEIYEGDIVRFYQIQLEGFSIHSGSYKREENKECRGVITYKQGAFYIDTPYFLPLNKWVFYNSPLKNIYSELSIKEENMTGYWITKYINIEVLGNIYENPELIKGVKDVDP